MATSSRATHAADTTIDMSSTVAFVGAARPSLAAPLRARRGASSARRGCVSVTSAAARSTAAEVPAAASQEAPGASVGFERPNEYGYFPSAVAAAEQKRAQRLEEGYTSIKGLSDADEKARYARLCSKHPNAGRCQEGFSQKLVTKPATQSMVNGSMVRSDGIILVPGNREDLITWALDPKMSGDTLGLLLPTLFVIIGAQLKQVAGVPEYVSGAVGITTKLIATGLVALYWLPDFTAGLVQ